MKEPWRTDSMPRGGPGIELDREPSPPTPQEVFDLEVVEQLAERVRTDARALERACRALLKRARAARKGPGSP